MKQELLEQGRGGLLVTGSTSQGEHFTYNQDGSGNCRRILRDGLSPPLDRQPHAAGRRYAVRGHHGADDLQRPVRGAVAGRPPHLLLHAVHGEKEIPAARHFLLQRELPARGRRTAAEGVLPHPGRRHRAEPVHAVPTRRSTSTARPFEIKQETAYPTSGEVKLSFTCSEPVEFAFLFRTPRWAEKIECAVNGAPCTPTQSQLGYAVIKRVWKSGDTLTISMPMSWRFVRGRMIQDGRVALMRGPVLFTFSENPERGRAQESARTPRPGSRSASIGDPSADRYPSVPTDRRSSSRHGRIPSARATRSISS